ncbi:MAG TPA: hypothetical protein PKD68_02790 [Candidatus Saccharibacteria bacterium]|nr:hypothetical protein [Candidatus Saccharibacteria bacterium]
MKASTRILLALSPIATALLLAAVLVTTDPLNIGPVGIMGVFVLVYLFSLSLTFVVLHFGIYWVSRLVILKRDTLGQREWRVGARKAYYVASVIAFVPVLFLAMQSFAELRVSDILLVGAFVAIAVFYIVKRS